jgi:hypothetical protein
LNTDQNSRLKVLNLPSFDSIAAVDDFTATHMHTHSRRSGEPRACRTHDPQAPSSCGSSILPFLLPSPFPMHSDVWNRTRITLYAWHLLYPRTDTQPHSARISNIQVTSWDFFDLPERTAIMVRNPAGRLVNSGRHRNEYETAQ